MISFKVFDAATGKEPAHPFFPPSTDWSTGYGSNPGHYSVMFGLNNLGTTSANETRQVYAVVSWT